MVRGAYRGDNCASQSEFIEKAVRFYCGYLEAEKDGAYLPKMCIRDRATLALLAVSVLPDSSYGFGGIYPPFLR